jgi:hypothetical protein
MHIQKKNCSKIFGYARFFKNALADWRTSKN